MKTDLKSTITEQAGAVLGGGFSSLWLPETYLSTYGTFLTGASLAGRASTSKTFFGRGGFFNKGRWLRIGWGKYKGKVFRISGDIIKLIKKSGRIDIFRP